MDKSDQSESIRCFLAIQQLKKWRRILDDPGIAKSQRTEVKKKLSKVLDIIFSAHGSEKAHDELVSTLYYGLLDDVRTVKEEYELWRQRYPNGSPERFLKDPRNAEPVRIIERFFLGEDWTLDEKANYLIDGRASEVALALTAQLLELSEARTEKKVKKMYKK